MAKSTSGRSGRTYDRSISQLVYDRPVNLTPLVHPLTEISIPQVLLNDRRLFHPSKPVRESRATLRNTRQQRQTLSPALRYMWSDPSRKLAVCVRRRIRKQVLHALRKSGGRSGRSQKRFNITSKVKC